MTGIKDRMLEFISYLGITQAKFEESTGMSNGYVNNLGESIRPSSLKKISATYPELNTNWLLTGVENMIIGDAPATDTTFNFEEINLIDTAEKYEMAMKIGLHLIPERNVFFKGGNEVLENDNIEYIERYWHIPGADDCTDIITMSGNSMSSVLPNGTKMALKPIGWDKNHPNEIPFGSIFAILVEDRVTGKYHGHVKYLRKHKDTELAKKYWIARSKDTENYDDFDIDITLVRGLWIVKEYMIKTLIR